MRGALGLLAVVALLTGASCGLIATEDAHVSLAMAGVTTNGSWAPLIREFEGVPMALVPAGCFLMGGTHLPDEGPVHRVCLEEPFWIDVFETTGVEFAAFMNTVGRNEIAGWTWIDGYNTFDEQFVRVDGAWTSQPGYEKSAVFGVTWHEASSYCACRGARLPTEAEWEYAARGPDGLTYPWGDDLIPENVAKIYDGTAIDGAVPAIIGRKASGISWVGTHDMSGNVFEWTHSIHLSYPYDATDGREAPIDIDSSSKRVLRGCAWYHTGWIDPVEAAARFVLPPDLTSRWVGFRCVRDLGS